jgi:hypothetical protein
MLCREFLRHLREYLRGQVSEPLFGALVEHEAECATCRAHAAELDVEPSPTSAAVSASEEEVHPVRRRILERTAGRDCRWVELRMAEALEDEPSSDLRLLVSNHVTECASCRRMRDMLQALPAYYELLPQLRPGASFTNAVLERTVGPRPSFFDVVRALWRRPEAMWEAAMACALAAVLLFGKHLPTFDQITHTMEEVSQATGLFGLDRLSDPFGEGGVPAPLQPLADTFGALQSRWQRVEASAVEASEWTRRVGNHLREGDPAALLREIRVVLEPLGLYPGNGEEADSVLPNSRDENASAPSGADSTTTTLSGEVR